MKTVKAVIFVFFSLVLFDCQAVDRPHIVLIVADDLGWDDVGFHGSEIPTPNIDALAYDGIILNNYYVQPVCTPSRSALMTAKYPIHTGMQHATIGAAEPWGLGLSEKLLPQFLKEIKYKNHIVGKWHLGFYAWEYTPLYRGFDTHYGYYNGHEDYYSHDDGYGAKLETWGIDFRDNKDVEWSTIGKYSTELYGQRAQKIIKEHNTSEPLFLYLAHQGVHAGNFYDPLQSPEYYFKNFTDITNMKRRIFAGMVAAVDESVANVTMALHEKGMLNNTIIIFTTDNGGPTNGYDGNAACNWPLRGCKNTLWEGGVQGNGFLWSPLLKKSGYVSNHMMHITDWLPTVLSAVGYDKTKLPSDLDGKDMWSTLSTDQPVSESPRSEVLLNIDPVDKMYAFRMGDMKIVYGDRPKYDGWYPPLQADKETNQDSDTLRFVPRDMLHETDEYDSSSFSMNINENQNLYPDGKESKVMRALNMLNRGNQKGSPVLVNCGPKPQNASTNCKPKESPCLYNITSDPCEYNNLAQRYPSLLKQLLEKVTAYNETMVAPRNKPEDPAGYPGRHGRVWEPWVNLTIHNQDKIGVEILY